MTVEPSRIVSVSELVPFSLTVPAAVAGWISTEVAVSVPSLPRVPVAQIRAPATTASLVAAWPSSV